MFILKAPSSAFNVPSTLNRSNKHNIRSNVKAKATPKVGKIATDTTLKFKSNPSMNRKSAQKILKTDHLVSELFKNGY